MFLKGGHKMNDINFVHSLSRTVQRSINRWLLISIGIIIPIVAAITALQLWQWFTLGKLKREQKILHERTADFETVLNKKQALLQTKEQLEKQLNTLYRRKTNPKLPTDLMTALRSVAGTAIQLQGITLEKDRVQITGLATQPAQATQFAAQLANNAPLKEVKLVNLKNQSTSNVPQLLFTIEALLKKMNRE